jgi:hypothetical protein
MLASPASHPPPGSRLRPEQPAQKSQLGTRRGACLRLQTSRRLLRRRGSDGAFTDATVSAPIPG